MGLEAFTDILVAFTKTADPQVIVAILLLTFTMLRAVWLPLSLNPATISLFSLFVSVPISAMFSLAEETTWGGRWFWRTVIQNGCSSVALWYVFTPQIFAKWPGLLNDEVLLKKKAALKEELHVLTKEEQARLDDQKRTELKGGEGE